MKKLILAFAFVIVTFSAIQAQQQQYVQGHYRKNGTYVQPYTRSKPDVYKYNNNNYGGNTSDQYNNRSYRQKYGYDPEPPTEKEKQ